MLSDILNDSKYSKYYINLIESRRNVSIDGYRERHHIIPKSLGGTNSKDNIINLTAREHFIAHLLLVKATKNTSHYSKMAFALTRLVHGNKKNYTLNSRTYQYIREINSIESSIRSKKAWDSKSEFEKEKWKNKYKGENNPMYGKTHSQNTRQKIAIQAKKRLSDKENHPMYGKSHTEDTKIKISKNRKNKNLNYSWFYNSDIKEEKLSNVCPNGWKKGRLPDVVKSPKASKGKKWYHHPVTKKEKYFIFGQEPEGFILGRIGAKK